MSAKQPTPSAKRSIIPFRPRPDQRTREEMAFLPAALDIVETAAEQRRRARRDGDVERKRRDHDPGEQR